MLLSLLLPLVLLLAPPGAAAAEVLQVRRATLLQVGDSNRSYSVVLACVEVDPAQEDAVVDWLRGQLPRGTKVNLRPAGQRDGQLLARVRTGAKRGRPSLDLGTALMAEGLATPLAEADPLACAETGSGSAKLS
ncbi:MAG: nuclease [Cyanobacteria bacterium J06638_7]